MAGPEPDYYLVWKTRGPIRRLVSPLAGLISDAAWGGVLLLVCALIALYLANSGWEATYHHVLETPIHITVGAADIEMDLHHFINDALMAIFFFLVGLEIKREILVGELSHPREAALPVVAALGGMIVPAAAFLALNIGQPGQRGWGIPMATDIAFSLGILSLLGSRVPLSAKVFLTAFAIVDDIGASMVIAFFYTESISWIALGAGAVFFIALIGCNLYGVRTSWPYIFLSVLLWACFLKSGVHPTIAGILAALTIPARPRLQSDEFLVSTRMLIDRIEKERETQTDVLRNMQKQHMLSDVELASKLTQTPLKRFEIGLHHWVMFFIMPVFALANAGVTLHGSIAEQLTGRLTLGIILGLVLGKQIGVTLFSWIAIKLGWARLPRDVNWGLLYGLSWLGGIGFTMSLFITNLAFPGDSVNIEAAKIGILVASAITVIGGSLIVWLNLPREPVQSDPESVDEAVPAG